MIWTNISRSFIIVPLKLICQRWSHVPDWFQGGSHDSVAIATSWCHGYLCHDLAHFSGLENRRCYLVNQPKSPQLLLLLVDFLPSENEAKANLNNRVQAPAGRHAWKLNPGCWCLVISIIVCWRVISSVLWSWIADKYLRLLSQPLVMQLDQTGLAEMKLPAMFAKWSYMSTCYPCQRQEAKLVACLRWPCR